MNKVYTLVIADDEYIVRRGLRETIDWNALGIKIVAECENGRQALDAVKRYHPDLVITDVRMPVMDGLQLADAISAGKFDCAVIFYSGYSDFEYARKALEYGVASYILKPIENDEFVTQVQKAIQSLELSRSRNKAFDNLETSVAYMLEMYFTKLTGGVDDEALRTHLEEGAGVRIPNKGTIVCCRAFGSTEGGVDDTYEAIDKALQNFPAAGSKTGYGFVFCTNLTDGEALCTRISSILSARRNTEGARCSVAVSRPFGGELSRAQAAAEAKRLAEKNVVLGMDSVNVCGGGGGKEYKSVVAEALRLIGERYAEKMTVKQVAKELFVSESYLIHEFAEELDKSFIDCLREYRIMKAKELLEKGGMRVSEVAERVGFSDVKYFAKTFKKETGKSPREYMDGTDD